MGPQDPYIDKIWSVLHAKYMEKPKDSWKNDWLWRAVVAPLKVPYLIEAPHK